eukprot:GHVR01150187.1.p1 GENE.GHVR01150187.1~~GHVR01150187.1.p1  ORF type:complete len:155 (+),score=10.76 GHVR01150187.1:1-465(+)
MELVMFLVDKGADVNATDKDRRNALMYASMNGHLEVVKFLIEKKADVRATGRFGKTSLIHASNGGHMNVVIFLIEEGAHVNAEVVKALMTADVNVSGKVCSLHYKDQLFSCWLLKEAIWNWWSSWLTREPMSTLQTKCEYLFSLKLVNMAILKW